MYYVCNSFQKILNFVCINAATLSLIYVYQPVTYGDPSPNIADKNIIIADIGHFESEQYTKELIYDLLREKFTKFAIRLSKLNTNPINYL